MYIGVRGIGAGARDRLAEARPPAEARPGEGAVGRPGREDDR